MQSNHTRIPLIKTFATINIFRKINLVVFMAEEGSEASVASSSPTPNWWEIHTNPVLSWNITMKHRWQPHFSSSSFEDQEMMSNISTSFTNASNQSGLSMGSSSVQVVGEPTDNQLWSQVLYGVENIGGALHNNGVESFLDMLSSKNHATELFNPECDYLKKCDSSWVLTNHTQINHTQVDNLEKHMMSSYNIGATIEPNRLTNLSDLVNWSIAPPNTASNPSQFKCELPSYVHDNYHNAEAWESSSLPRPYSSTDVFGHQFGLNNSLIGINNNKRCNGVSSDAHLSNSARTFSGFLSFNNKTSVKGSESVKKQGHESSSSTTGSGRVGGRNGDGKKKRSEDSAETLLSKKSKNETSNASSVKMQPPKVKLQEKISALQQIVSPFGKTDTASVLMEAINYIGFLHDQVQLLSDPYMKTSANKDLNSWGGLERKNNAEPRTDLRSRGLCLVPISCTPQSYRENTGPDNWPTYRGCLFR